MMIGFGTGLTPTVQDEPVKACDVAFVTMHYLQVLPEYHSYWNMKVVRFVFFIYLFIYFFLHVSTFLGLNTS